MNARLAVVFLGAVTWAASSARAGEGPRVAVLSDAAAWKALPPTEEGGGQPLPIWIRTLAVSLPKTAAAMLELDYAQRKESTLSPLLRAKLRWIAADANRCEYGRAYARFDYLQAGGKAEDLVDLPHRLEQLPEAERLALQLVRQLVVAAYTVSDEQMARLVTLHGDKQVVGMVLVAAYANFQDRLLLALGANVEPNGPLAPVKVRFPKPPPPPKEKKSAKKAEKPPRVVSPPSKNPPPVAERLNDPEWADFSFEKLRERLDAQIARRQARVPVPEWETVAATWPEGTPKPDKPLRIKWSLVTYGYQPRLTAAWLGGLRAFRQESDLDPVFHESMFWVVTRSLQCFY